MIKKLKQNFPLYKVNIFIVFILLVSLTIVAQITSNAVFTEDKTVLQNTTDVYVLVLFDNNESVAGFQFQLNYPSEVEFKELQLTNRLSEANTTIEVNSSTLGVLKIAAISEPGISSGNSSILEVVFDIPYDAEPGSYNISFSSVILANISASSLDKEVAGGIFTILADSDYDSIPDVNDSCPLIVGCSLHNGCDFGLDFWLPPISTEDEFDLQQGATLPLKFEVSGCDNEFYSDSSILVRVVNQTLGTDVYYNASGVGDDFIDINHQESQYHVNIHTNQLNMSLGNYTIYTLFSNDLSSEIIFELKTNGKGKGKKNQ